MVCLTWNKMLNVSRLSYVRFVAKSNLSLIEYIIFNDVIIDHKSWKIFSVQDYEIIIFSVDKMLLKYVKEVTKDIFNTFMRNKLKKIQKILN